VTYLSLCRQQRFRDILALRFQPHQSVRIVRNCEFAAEACRRTAGPSTVGTRTLRFSAVINSSSSQKPDPASASHRLAHVSLRRTVTSESQPRGARPSQAVTRAPWTPPDLSLRIVNEKPFRHATFRECLAPSLSGDILAWFEYDAPWRLKRTDFYEQYEFSCWDSTSPIASHLTSSTVLEVIRSEMMKVFGRTFEEPISVVAHKLLEGQRIGIHNDYLVGEESHRLVIQLNHGLSDDDG
jgi:hypothetical protein